MQARGETASSTSDTPQRIHKLIAASGLCSRRKAEELIAQGRVTLGGKTVLEPGSKASPSDDIRVDGKPLARPRRIYLAMHKPAGYLTTLHDAFGRRTVAQLLPEGLPPLKPIGRLDQDTEGLLLFTNDGEFAHRLAHPRWSVEKEYEVVVEGLLEPEQIERLERGIVIEGRRTSPAKVLNVRRDEAKARSSFRIVIHEGRKRQIRLMCLAIGAPVRSLRRVRVGPIVLGRLRKGMCRMLDTKEVAALERLVGLR